MLSSAQAQMRLSWNDIAMIKTGVSIFQESTNNVKFSHGTHINFQLAFKINKLNIISDITRQPLDWHPNFTHCMII